MSSELADLSGRLDLVLIDAPCTGIGAWRRNPDAKWRVRPTSLEVRMAEQAEVQDRAPHQAEIGWALSPEHQGQGIGSLLLQHLETLTNQRILIGTWSDATWAIRFYQAHGYTLIPRDETPHLLDTYWGIPPRQVETSVVLAKAPRPGPTPPVSPSPS